MMSALAGQNKSFDQEFGNHLGPNTKIKIKNIETDDIEEVTLNSLYKKLINEKKSR